MPIIPVALQAMTPRAMLQQAITRLKHYLYFVVNLFKSIITRVFNGTQNNERRSRNRLFFGCFTGGEMRTSCLAFDVMMHACLKELISNYYLKLIYSSTAGFFFSLRPNVMHIVRSALRTDRTIRYYFYFFKTFFWFFFS